MMMEHSLIPVIVGPTGVGKTGIAVRLAEQIDAEIISSDSRQIFRQMRIGTAVPDEDSLGRVRHHLIAELNIGDDYSAGIFAEQAARRISEIHARGKRVVITGGSTLYLQALTEGLDDVPDVDPEVRRRLNDRLHSEGPTQLYNELVEVDPEYAKTLDETKTQRIVRGLEIYHVSGFPLSQYFNEEPNRRNRYDISVLTRPRSILYDRINARVDEMIHSGLVSEVRDVQQFAVKNEVSIPATIGYRELLPVVAGERGLEEGIRLVKRNSRRYAKRQLTWFRSLEDAVWYDLEGMSEDDVIQRIIERLQPNNQ